MERDEDNITVRFCVFKGLILFLTIFIDEFYYAFL